MSASNASTSPSIAVAASRSRSSDRLAIATRAPSRASAAAIPCPIPLLAPNTSATRPSIPRSTVPHVIASRSRQVGSDTSWRRRISTSSSPTRRQRERGLQALAPLRPRRRRRRRRAGRGDRARLWKRDRPSDRGADRDPGARLRIRGGADRPPATRPRRGRRSPRGGRLGSGRRSDPRRQRRPARRPRDRADRRRCPRRRRRAHLGDRPDLDQRGRGDHGADLLRRRALDPVHVRLVAGRLRADHRRLRGLPGGPPAPTGGHARACLRRLVGDARAARPRADRDAQGHGRAADRLAGRPGEAEGRRRLCG